MPMLLLVILLCSFAAVPYAVLVYFPEDRYYAWFPGGMICFFFSTGVMWCSLFAFTCNRATSRQFKRLLWLLPLVLFAAGVPARLIWLAVGFWWVGYRGGALP